MAGETEKPSSPLPPRQDSPKTVPSKKRKSADSKSKRAAVNETSRDSPQSPAQRPQSSGTQPTVFPQQFPPPFIMNPSSFPGGSAYTPTHGYPPQGTAQQNPGNHAMAGHPPNTFSYALPPPYHPSAYPYQYQPVMMYGSPPVQSDTQQPVPPSPPPPSASTGTKRKRKSGSEKNRGKGENGSDEDTGPSASAPISAAELKKRTKTQRACDSCRSRKIRCDVLTAEEPPKCHHCKQYGFECTFFLPITETRFKKKKLEEENEKAEASRAGNSPAVVKPESDVGYGLPSAPHHSHSQASIPPRVYDGYDLRYQHAFEITTNGEGLIRVRRPSRDDASNLPKATDVQIEPGTIQSLVNAYFFDVAPLMLVITKEEFLKNTSPPPILLFSMCLVAAARREVPQGIFDAIRYVVNNLIRADDVLSTASIVNVQALLILCMTGDCHSQFVPNALSAMWVRLGSAIRMAQDLGLHRAESVRQDIELRRRLWRVCVICDRWMSLTFGHPYMIDVQDCDARLPSSGDPDQMYMNELLKLSIVLGNVLKTMYSPAGLTIMTDDMLYAILADIEGWQHNLPEQLKFKGYHAHRNAGLLHLFYSCVCMVFWRVFMRISYSCPAHLKFGLTVEQWSKLVTLTGDAIDWLDANEEIYDVWLVVAYAATSCALVQYHTWARRKDADAAQKLRKLRDCVRRWEGSLSPDHMSARRKTAEIIALLYEATQLAPPSINASALNAAVGVPGKQPVNSLEVYQKDPTRPGGGVFVANGQAQSSYNDLPAGNMMQSSNSEGEATPGASVSPNNSNDLNHGFLSSLSTSSAFAPPLPPNDGSLMSAMNASGSNQGNFNPMGGSDNRGSPYYNVNPALNAQTGPQSQVINILDLPQDTLAELSMTDTGFLDGIPGGMFDWGQWETFFSRFNNGTVPDGSQGGIAGMSAPQQQQQQQIQPSPQ